MTVGKTLARWCLVVGMVLACGATLAQAQQNFVDAKPSPQQVAWQDLEFGVIIHFSTNTYLDREWGDGTASPAVFNPTAFNPDQWMQAIRRRERSTSSWWPSIMTASASGRRRRPITA